jgi:DNA-directed RNA polymerase specialized sigma24 family protein
VAVASAVEITLSQEERSELERRAGKLTLPYRDVQRAKVVLYAAEGMSNVEIAGRLEMCSKVVGQWRRRFGEQRLEGLLDQPRSGRPRRFPPARGRAGQGDRLRAAQDARRPVIALQPV